MQMAPVPFSDRRHFGWPLVAVGTLRLSAGSDGASNELIDRVNSNSENLSTEAMIRNSETNSFQPTI